MPARFTVWLLFLAPAMLAGCGGSTSLKHAGKKAFVYTRAGTDPMALGTVALHTGLCPALEPSSVTITLGGRPLQLVDPGSIGKRPDGTCLPPVWKETVPTPATEDQTVLEASDGTETVHVTYGGLNQPPAVDVGTTGQLVPGASFTVNLRSNHLDDVIDQADFTPSGPHGQAGQWAHGGHASSSDPWTVSVPDDQAGAAGTLTLAVNSVIPSACDADVVCADETFIDPNGTLVMHTELAFVTAPVPVKVKKR